MTAALCDSWYMTQRHLLNLFRQPAWIAITLVQPLIYLLLYEPLFKRIVELPGFGAGSYVDFLTPGIVVMTALFSAGWTGMSVIEDIDRGVVDRFLVSPVSRGSLIAGRLIQLGLVAVIQSAILLGVGYLIGAQYPGGALGILVLVASAILLGAGFGALSTFLALLVRREETVIAAANLVLLPLTFLSSVFMAQGLMPAWMVTIARYNPVNWAAQAGRVALSLGVAWGYVLTRVGLLALFALVCTWMATRAFRVYQRSI